MSPCEEGMSPYSSKTEKFTRNKEGSNVFVWERVCNTDKYLWQSETGANIYVVVRNFYHKLFLIILQLLTKKGYACQTIEYMHHYTPSYGWFYLRDWYWFLSYFFTYVFHFYWSEPIGKDVKRHWTVLAIVLVNSNKLEARACWVTAIDARRNWMCFSYHRESDFENRTSKCLHRWY